MELVVTEKALNMQQKKFCQYLCGEASGNATEAYKLAYSVVGKELSVNTCGSCGSALRNDPRIQAYLRELTEAQAAKLQDKLKRWEDLAPEAQAVLVECMRGTCRSRMRFEAALICLDRALGKVVNRTELEVSLDADQVLTALHSLANRKLLGDGRG